jgi:hypothetical protein
MLSTVLEYYYLLLLWLLKRFLVRTYVVQYTYVANESPDVVEGYESFRRAAVRNVTVSIRTYGNVL